MTAWGPLSQFPPSVTLRTTLPVRAATVENFGIGLAGPGTARTDHKTLSRTPATTRNWPPVLWTSRLLPIKKDWIDITQPDCATWESRRHVFSAAYACLWLLQSVPTVLHRGSCKPEVVIHGGSRCARRVFPTAGHCLRATPERRLFRTCHPWHSRSSFNVDWSWQLRQNTVAPYVGLI